MHTELDETGQTFLGWSNFYLEPPTESGHPGADPSGPSHLACGTSSLADTVKGLRPS